MQEKQKTSNIDYLHNLLDHQLESVKQIIQTHPGFDQIQNKLKLLEVKLGQIKEDNSIKIQSFDKIGRRNSLTAFNNQKIRSNTKNRSSKHIKNSYHRQMSRQQSLTQKIQNQKSVQNLETENKEYGSNKKRLTKKTKSQAILTNALQTQEAPNRRKYESATKKKKKQQELSQSIYVQQKQKKSLRKKISSKKMLNYSQKQSKGQKNLRRVKTRNTILENITKDKMANQLTHLKKQNQHLKSRVSELKKYERDFLKMVEIFQKGQFSRNNRLIRHHV